MIRPGNTNNHRWICLAILLAITAPNPALASTPAQIQDAIQKGRLYLRAQQKDGNWESPRITKPTDPDAPTRADAGQYGGYTALATYALLAAGDRPTSPDMSQAINFLSTANISGTYALALRAQVWPYLSPSSQIKQMMLRDAALLRVGMRSRGDAQGMYSYLPGNTEQYDHSNSQMAILGMWALRESDAVEVPDSYWSAADTAWRKQQIKDGSWCYVYNSSDAQKSRSYVSMTAAGVATLFITSDELGASRFAGCHGNLPDHNIDTGLTWIGDHFPTVFDIDRTNTQGQYYTLFGIERIGVASGRKYLGTHDWYAEGADWLLSHQNADGSWGSPSDLWGNNYHNIAQTSFALLFLMRGRAPIIMNKLQYDISPQPESTGESWNQRPRDLAHLSRWMGKQAEADFNWQTISLAASVDDLHDAPILYITGSAKLSFTAEEKNKLRQFAQEGGLILGNADCGSAEFSASFKALGSELFPYAFRVLPAKHPLYANEQWTTEKWKADPDLQGLSNGVRELMILIPQADISRNWQVNAYIGHEEPFELGDDIVRYATDQQFRIKGDTYLVHADESIKAARAIKVARIRYEGNWDPEPAGWRRMAAILHNQHQLDLDIQTITLGEGTLKGHAIAHLTGAGAFKLSDAALAELKSYLDKGGTLIIDAAGGSTDFAASAQALLTSLYPDAAEQLKMPLPPDHAVFSAATGKPTAIVYRRWIKKLIPENLVDPRIRAIQQNGRITVFYSPEDLSAGLVGESIDGIAGYTPATATQLMEDILLYATHRSVK